MRKQQKKRQDFDACELVAVPNHQEARAKTLREPCEITKSNQQLDSSDWEMSVEATGGGTDPAGSNTYVPPIANEYEHVIDILIGHYTKLDKAADLLPLISVTPLLSLLWASIKSDLALTGDILLIIPINAVILVRNIFPGNWRYKCWSWKYIKTCGSWLWRGEYSIPLINFRPLTIFFLHWHFRRRLSAIRHLLLLETGFSEDRAKAAIAKIDRANAQMHSNDSAGSGQVEVACGIEPVGGESYVCF